jgi:hypothetical protein
MPIRQPCFPLRAVALAAAASTALATAAWAKDLPPTPEGAQKINAFFAAYLGKAAAPPAIVVTSEASDYAVSFDLAQLTAPLQALGVTYEPATIRYKLIEQDDGAWRVTLADFPPIVVHHNDRTTAIALTGYRGEYVVDPAIAWFRSGSAGADKLSVKMSGPHREGSVEAGALQANFTGAAQAGADGAVSSTLQESVAGVAASFSFVKADAQADPAAKPVSIAVRLDKAAVDASLEGLRSRAALELWAFLAAHPNRADLAADEAKLKALLTAALDGRLALNETISAEKTTAELPQGAVAFDSAKVGFGGATGAAGGFEEHFAVSGLTLPPGLVPALYRGFVPSALDVGFKASGFDVAAASAEAVADLHLAGDAPPISSEDSAKIWAKLIGPAGATIDIPPSHIVAPLLDLSFQGQVRYQASKPVGAVTIRLRNFDQTQAGLKGLGPEAEKKLTPFLAMAKGLGKAEADGGLTWAIELAADGMMKVNGLPLGKAPI